MISDLALTLKAARRQSGFSQSDVAHLLGVHKSILTPIEKGRRLPSVRQLCELSIVYNTPPSELLGEALVDSSAAIAVRLETLPKRRIVRSTDRNRQSSLDALAERLSQVMYLGQ